MWTKAINWQQHFGPLTHIPLLQKAHAMFWPVYRTFTTAYLLVFPADIEHDFIPAGRLPLFVKSPLVSLLQWDNLQSQLSLQMNSQVAMVTNTFLQTINTFPNLKGSPLDLMPEVPVPSCKRNHLLSLQIYKWAPLEDSTNNSSSYRLLEPTLYSLFHLFIFGRNSAQ